jgi:hypothetical protein
MRDAAIACTLRATALQTVARERSLTAAPAQTPSDRQDKVTLRTVEGRRLRRSVLKGAVVAFITAGAQRGVRSGVRAARWAWYGRRPASSPHHLTKDPALP